MASEAERGVAGGDVVGGSGFIGVWVCGGLGGGVGCLCGAEGGAKPLLGGGGGRTLIVELDAGDAGNPSMFATKAAAVSLTSFIVVGIVFCTRSKNFLSKNVCSSERGFCVMNTFSRKV